jgi:hypothetical protein
MREREVLACAPAVFRHAGYRLGLFVRGWFSGDAWLGLGLGLG